MIQLEKGKTYAWCACGKSDNQPWCNGAHKGSGVSPTVFIAEETKTVSMCMCTHTKNPPYCDGSHSSL
jgi:CDGSH-type Zn-finger protein